MPEKERMPSPYSEGDSTDIVWHDVPRPDDLKKVLTDAIMTGTACTFAAETAVEALRRFDTIPGLCALRQGPYGVADINVLIEEILMKKGLIDPQQRWYKGRPVLYHGSTITI